MSKADLAAGFGTTAPVPLGAVVQVLALRPIFTHFDRAALRQWRHTAVSPGLPPAANNPTTQLPGIALSRLNHWVVGKSRAGLAFSHIARLSHIVWRLGMAAFGMAAWPIVLSDKPGPDIGSEPEFLPPRN